MKTEIKGSLSNFRVLQIIGLIYLLSGCQNESQDANSIPKIYLGADLSYVNEVEDCGAVFRKNGAEIDPFDLFATSGASLVRVRLWHNPDWTQYSDFEDAVRTMKRAKASNMNVMLDFHYSDTWADPGDQIIPKAWANIKNVSVLADSLYTYTYSTLMKLNNMDLMPEFVQVGNETNSEILLPDHVDELTEPINWHRNVTLFNAGLKAVNDAARDSKKEVKSMIHIAQPEFAFTWFSDAQANGLEDFDWIALSYYPLWSKYQIPDASKAIDSLKKMFEKPIMVVETAYPYVIDEFDQANNILWDNAVLENYPATPEGQLNYMIDLTQQVIDGGGQGVIYWEPAWVSTSCKTLWGKGSHWENATFFDAANNNEALSAFEYFDITNYTINK